MKFFKTTVLILSICSIQFLSTSCSSDDGFFANVTLSQGNTPDVDGDFTGNGGSTTKSYTWQNSRPTAEYNADITATTNGVFQMIIKDAQGVIVLDRSLNGNVEPNSFSGVTTSGTSGQWTVTIVLTNFNGDGSFSISQGT